jgi:isoquinoline 1-oxidoreductase alpha subunit
MRSCSVPVIAAEGTSVTTIEGLAPPGGLHPVQQAWIDHQVPQCGYCQSGMIMAVSALLATQPRPTDQQVDEAITNICRCGTFARVRRAIQALASPDSATVDPASASLRQPTPARRSDAGAR